MKLIFPIPSSKISANQSYGRHWSSTTMIKKSNRSYAHNITMVLIANNIFDFHEDDQLELRLDVYYKNRRHLDDDNLLSAFKHYRDGIFDALKSIYNLNDRQITRTLLDTSSIDKENPRIELELIKRV